MLRALLVDHIRDPRASWVCGRFGAIAEFHRDPDEPAEIATGSVIEASTSRGAIRIDVLPELLPVAYETISSCIESWGQGVALCPPRDMAAILRPRGRNRARAGPCRRAAAGSRRILFDLGLGGEQAAICLRSAAG